MQKYLQSHFYKISNKKMSSELGQAGVIKKSGKDYSFLLPKKLRKEYKQENTRYYHIFADAMDSLVASKCDNVFELFGSSLRKYK